MRVLLITVGSRGDAEPFCSLAKSLAKAKHDVDIFLQTDLQYLVPKVEPDEGVIESHELPFTQLDFYKFMANPANGQDNEDPRVKFLGIVTDIIGGLVLPCAAAILKAAEKTTPDVIVASSLARQTAVAVSDKLVNIPVCWVHLQPLVPTGMFPHYSKKDDAVKALLAMLSGEAPEEHTSGVNRETYLKLERYQEQFLRENIKKVYKDLNIQGNQTFEAIEEALLGRKSNMMMVNAFSQQLIPICPDQKSVHIVDAGPLADTYVPSGWVAPEELLLFLQSCKRTGSKPVCVGFGSMPFDKAKMIVEGVGRTKEPCILVGRCMQPAVDPGNPNLLVIDSAPYAWLLPQCSMMISHGGAGVVNATLAAGIPAVISPVMGDQFFWASLIEAHGWGLQCGESMNTLSAEDVAGGIEKAKNCQEACNALGKKIQAQRIGSEYLVEQLNDWISK